MHIPVTAGGRKVLLWTEVCKATSTLKHRVDACGAGKPLMHERRILSIIQLKVRPRSVAET
jgi:hypothetical protein